MKKPKEEKESIVFVGKKIPGAYLFLRNGVVRCLDRKQDIGWGPDSTDEQREQFAKLLISVNTHELVNYTQQENETLCNVIKDLPVFKDDEWTITSEELIALAKIHLRDNKEKGLKGLRCIECGAYDNFVVTGYRVINVITPITFVTDFNDKNSVVDFEFNRIDGNVTDVHCHCTACGNSFDYEP